LHPYFLFVSLYFSTGFSFLTCPFYFVTS
jgi:hypothetical protein